MKGRQNVDDPSSVVSLTPQVRRSARKSVSAKSITVQAGFEAEAACEQEGAQEIVDNPAPEVPFTPQLRRSSRKTVVTKTVNVQAVSEAGKSSDDAHAQGREGNTGSSSAVANSLPRIRRSTRKSHQGKISKSPVQAQDYVERDPQVPVINLESDSEVQAGERSGDGSAKEESQGDKETGLLSLDAGAAVEAERSEKEQSNEITVHEEDDLHSGSIPTEQESDDQMKQKNLRDVFEKEGFKEHCGFVEGNNGEAGQKIALMQSDGQTQRNNWEDSPSVAPQALVEQNDDSSNVHGNEEDAEAADEEMAVLFSKSLRFQLHKNFMLSTKCGGEDHTSQDIGKEKTSDTIPRSTTSHPDGNKSTTKGPSASSLKVYWSPNYDLPLLDSKQQSGQKSVPGKDRRILHPKEGPRPQGVVEGKLQDGLFLPPNDPRKLKKMLKKEEKDTAGAKWFNMPAPTITPELKKELQLLKLRSVIDPKRHYKSEDSKALPKYFQIGTVVETPADFYSGRLTKKEQKASFADELLSDIDLSKYRKRKYSEIQDIKQAGGKNFWKHKKNQRKPSWAKV